jgi:hypothetical protein
MKTAFGVTLAAVLVICVAGPSAVLAQQKTVRACRDEWRASTDPAKGTQKVYVAKCRAGATAAAPGAPAAAPAAAPSDGGKTVRACRDEWRASADPNKGRQKDYVAKCRAGTTAAAPAAPAVAPSASPASAGKTVRACRDEWRASTDPNKGRQKDYVARCRGEGAATATPATPPAEPAARTAAPAPAAPAPTAAAPAPAPSSATTRTGANQFSSEAQAKARCPSDTVVWVNLDSKIYHFGGTRNYGTTKKGAYMCERDALGETFRAAKNEKHP